MDTVFIKLVNMSITAGWLVLAVLILRLLLKSAPKWIRCILWGFVAVRLLIPIFPTSTFSLIPSANSIPQTILMTHTPSIQTGFSLLDQAVNPFITTSLAPKVGESVNPIQILYTVLLFIWILGIIAILTYALISYIRIYKKIQEGIHLEENIWLCDRISTPFVLGIFHPHIYIPTSVSAKDRKYVIYHEKAHIKRNDHLFKLLGFLLLAIYWINPLLWVAYIFFCRDMELACDEKVLRQFGTQIKKPYSNALINCSVSSKIISACPLTFSETGVKERIKEILHYKKPTLWIILAAILVCLVTALCGLTNPLEPLQNYTLIENGSDIDGLSLSVKELSFNAPTPFIQIEWKNESASSITYPESFDIQYYHNDTYTSCATNPLIFDAIAHMLPSKGIQTKSYDISAFNLSRYGRYRFQVECFPNQYVWVDFER